MVQAPYGFFSERRRIEAPLSKPTNGKRLVEYANVSPLIGAVVSTKLASLNELQTVYSFRDALDLLEISNVDNHNEKIMSS